MRRFTKQDSTYFAILAKAEGEQRAKQIVKAVADRQTYGFSPEVARQLNTKLDRYIRNK